MNKIKTNKHYNIINKELYLYKNVFNILKWQFKLLLLSLKTYVIIIYDNVK